MYRVLKNECLRDKIYLLEIEAPLVVNNCLPGQFCIVMAREKSERIPLTIYKYDKNKGIVSLIYQVVGASTSELTAVEKEIYAIIGPLGKPSILINEIPNLKDKKVLFVAGGIGIAPVIPQIQYLKERNISVDLIYGTKTRDALILEDEIKALVDNLTIVTDDGSFGIKGVVTDALKDIKEDYEYCVAIGPVVMMKYVAIETKKKNIKTIVSMNPIMVDGTGMCGACRLNVGGVVKFACVDGPEFDGHLVDFDQATKRLQTYKTFEGRKYLEIIEGDTHHGGCGNCEYE